MFDKEILEFVSSSGERHSPEAISRAINVPTYLLQTTLDKLVRDFKITCGEHSGRRFYTARTVSSRQEELDTVVAQIESEQVSGHVPTDPTAIIQAPQEVAQEYVRTAVWDDGVDPWSLIGDVELEGGQIPLRNWIVEALGWEFQHSGVTKEQIASVKPCDSPIRWMGGKSDLLPWMLERFPDHYGYVEVFGGSLKPFFAKRPSQVEVVNDKYEALINFWRVASQWPKQLTKAVNEIPSSRILHRLFNRDVHRSFNGYDPVDRFQRAVMFGYLNRTAFNGQVWGSYSGSIHVAQPTLDESRMVAAAERLRHTIIECQDFRDLIKRYGIKRCTGPVLVYLDPPYVNTAGYKLGFPDEWHHDIADLMLEIHKAGNFVMLSNSSHAEKLYSARWRGISEAAAFRWERRKVRYSVAGGDIGDDAITSDEEIVVANFKMEGKQGGLFA